VRWTDGTTSLLTWLGPDTKPLDADWLAAYRRSVEKSGAVSGYPTEAMKAIFARLNETPHPWRSFQLPWERNSSPAFAAAIATCPALCEFGPRSIDRAAGRDQQPHVRARDAHQQREQVQARPVRDELLVRLDRDHRARAVARRLGGECRSRAACRRGRPRVPVAGRALARLRRIDRPAGHLLRRPHL